MAQDFAFSADPMQEQLHGFTRSLTEIQWLTLVLVMLFIFLPGETVENRDQVIVAMTAFGAFVLTFSYTGFFREDSLWRLAVETWAMIAFITFVLWSVGSPNSVLANLYLLVVIAAALTLGKLMTLLEVALIAACYMFLHYHLGNDVFSLAYAGKLLMEMSPLLLVAYLTTMLAADIHFAHRKIRALAGTDELTGLLNLRGFNSILQREHDQAVRYARSYAVLILDIDNMKLINDTHGHDIGNQVLKLLSATLRRTVRNTDAAARFGGDEFVVLLVESPPEATVEAVARIRKQVDSLALSVARKEVEINVSIGVAQYPLQGAEPDDILRQADVDMYAEKRSKRRAAEADDGVMMDDGDAGAPAGEEAG